VKTFVGDRTRMIALPYSEKNMLGRFHPIPERHGQTDGRTDRIAISISHYIKTMRKITVERLQ